MPGSQSTAEKSRNEGYNIDITGVICETLYHFEKFYRISLWWITVKIFNILGDTDNFYEKKKYKLFKKIVTFLIKE